MAERLAKLSGLPRAFFCNSGAEAVEACLKFARRYWYTRGEPRAEFIALEGSFHGRTFGALSVTSDEHYRRSVRAARARRTLGARERSRPHSPTRSRPTRRPIIVEGIQGEGGVRPLSPAVRGGGQRGLGQDRRAHHRRRDPVRPRPDRAIRSISRRSASSRICRPSERRSAAACRSARRSSAKRSRRPSRSATTEAPTAATCSPAAPRLSSSSSS